MCRRRRKAFFLDPAATWCLVLFLGAGGCRLFRTHSPTHSPTQVDRLIHAYPQLESGRFAVVADFENPAHRELVQLVSVSSQARWVWDSKHGRKDTGRRCLRFTSGSDRDTIVLNNAHATQWYLPRDWHDYDTLLVSVASPQKGLTLEVSIVAGSEGNSATLSSNRPLRKGWNLLALDIAEAGERLSLDDVREIRFAVHRLSKPTTLYLDDIILASTQKNLFGDPQAMDGRLYARQVGRRWHVGAGGRFELVWAHGQIVGWYNLASDPNRVRNLVRGTTLGPSPLRIQALSDESASFSRFGEKVLASARLTRINAVRAVIETTWYFVDEANPRQAERPFQRWQYTIYPTGQLFVAVEATRRTKSWDPGSLGLAVTLTSDADDAWKIDTFQPGASSTSAWYAVARKAVGEATLLYIPYVPPVSEGTARWIQKADESRRLMSIVADTGEDHGSTMSWTCQLVLASSQEISRDEAAQRARVYQQPPRIRYELGHPLEPAERPKEGGAGYDRTTGCYRVGPESGRVRLLLEGGSFFSPAFEVSNPGETQAWVYVNHLIFQPVATEPTDRLVFQLPDTLPRRTRIEVLFRQDATAGSHPH